MASASPPSKAENRRRPPPPRAPGAEFSAPGVGVGDELRRPSVPRGVQLFPLRAVGGVDGAVTAGLLSRWVALGLSLDGEETGVNDLVGDERGVWGFVGETLGVMGRKEGEGEAGDSGRRNGEARGEPNERGDGL